MRRRIIGSAALLAVLAVVVACGSSGTPAASGGPTPGATVTSSPAGSPVATANGSPTTSGNVGIEPYDITIPTTWQEFNLADPAAKAGLDAFVEANPSLAASIQGFESIPGVRMAINPLVGDIVLILTTPSNGAPLEALAPTFTAQFQAVPGLQGTPAPEAVTLPGGPAVHWHLTLTSNKPGGGTVTAEESVYLFVSQTDAVIIEFVTPAGGAIPDEPSIVGSFRFKG